MTSVVTRRWPSAASAHVWRAHRRHHRPLAWERTTRQSLFIANEDGGSSETPRGSIGDALRDPFSAFARRRNVGRPTRRHRPPEHRVPAPPPWGRSSLVFLSRRVHLMARSKLHRLLKKSRPLSRSAQQRKLTLEALEDRTVLSFAPPVTFPVAVLPRAVTVGDFNNDGKSDLAVVNQGPSSTSQSSLSVLLGNGNGSFQPAVTTNVQNSGPGTGIAGSAAVGDFNGDHLPDVALNTAGPAGPAVEVLLGKGDGSFQPNHEILSVGQTPLSVAVGDFDRNGALDLVTANSQGTLSVLLGNGGGPFRPRIDLAVGGSPHSVAVGDFNGDGRLDVVTTQQLTDTASLLLGHGAGTFG